MPNRITLSMKRAKKAGNKHRLRNLCLLREGGRIQLTEDEEIFGWADGSDAGKRWARWF